MHRWKGHFIKGSDPWDGLLGHGAPRVRDAFLSLPHPASALPGSNGSGSELWAGDLNTTTLSVAQPWNKPPGWPHQGSDTISRLGAAAAQISALAVLPLCSLKGSVNWGWPPGLCPCGSGADYRKASPTLTSHPEPPAKKINGGFRYRNLENHYRVTFFAL